MNNLEVFGKKFYTKDTIITDPYSYAIYGRIEEKCKLGNIGFNTDDFLFCYFLYEDNFILGTTDNVYLIKSTKKYVDYLKIPHSRILNVLPHHRWSVGDFIVFDLSTEDYELLATYSLVKNPNMQNIIDVISSYVNCKYSDNENVVYKFTLKNEKRAVIENSGTFIDKKTIELAKKEQSHWFNLPVKERIEIKNKSSESYEEIQQDNIKVENESLDYDNMSIEELQAQIEKEKLIAELKKLKAENSGVPVQQPKQVSQPKIVERPVSPIVSRPSRLDPQCPKCHSTNIVLIDNDVGDTKIVGNINPLHPLTIATVKKKPKKVRSKGKTVAAIMTGGLSMAVTGGTKKKVTQQWYCQDCGKKWYK